MRWRKQTGVEDTFRMVWTFIGREGGCLTDVAARKQEEMQNVGSLLLFGPEKFVLPFLI